MTCAECDRPLDYNEMAQSKDRLCGRCENARRPAWPPEVWERAIAEADKAARDMYWYPMDGDVGGQ